MADETLTPAPEVTPQPAADSPEVQQTLGTDAATAPDQAALNAHIDQTNHWNGLLHGVLGALGGTHETAYRVDPQSGKITQSTIQGGPGSQWNRIIAGALAGVAGTAGAHGPGRLGAAFGGGFQGGENVANQERQRPLQRAQQQSTQIIQANDQKTRQLLNQATVAHAQLGIIQAQQAIAQTGVKMSEEATTMADNFEKVLRAHPGSSEMGGFKDMAEAAAAVHSNPELAKQQASGELQFVPRSGGGIDVWHVEPSFMEQKIPKGYFLSFPGPDGKLEQKELAQGSMTNGEYFGIAQTQMKNQLTADWHEADANAAADAREYAADQSRSARENTSKHGPGKGGGTPTSSIPGAPNVKLGATDYRVLQGTQNVFDAATNLKRLINSGHGDVITGLAAQGRNAIQSALASQDPVMAAAAVQLNNLGLGAMAENGSRAVQLYDHVIANFATGRGKDAQLAALTNEMSSAHNRARNVYGAHNVGDTKFLDHRYDENNYTQGTDGTFSYNEQAGRPAVAIASKAEYDKLPAGATYTWNGQSYVKGKK